MRPPRIATTLVTAASSSLYSYSYSSSRSLATPLAAGAIIIGRRHRPFAFGTPFSSSITSVAAASSSALSLLSLSALFFGEPPVESRAHSAAIFACASSVEGEGNDDDENEAEDLAAITGTTTTSVLEDDGKCNATTTTPPPIPPLSEMYDPIYPGTSVRRLNSVHDRIATLVSDGSLFGRWEDVRRRLLWAGGLRDLPDARPGMGYTGHSFNDYNHVDLTTMNDDVSDNLNDGSVSGIAIGNRLGPGVRIASLPELGPGGSWSTCAIGCNKDPPRDVAHLQFRSRIAFKLVWVPNEDYDMFVLVNDDGGLLAYGKPSGGVLPNRREREMNYRIMMGSKYAVEAETLSGGGGTARDNATAESR
jgi:hypothetical protein